MRPSFVGLHERTCAWCRISTSFRSRCTLSDTKRGCDTAETSKCYEGYLMHKTLMHKTLSSRLILLLFCCLIYINTLNRLMWQALRSFIWCHSTCSSHLFCISSAYAAERAKEFELKYWYLYKAADARPISNGLILAWLTGVRCKLWSRIIWGAALVCNVFL